MWRCLDNIVWIRLPVIWECSDTWIASCGSGCLWCGDVQTSGQHPMDQVVCDVGFFKDLGNIPWIWLSDVGMSRHLGNILWIRLSGTEGCPGISATSSGSGSVIWDSVDARHLANIQWIKLSGTEWGPITGLTSNNTGVETWMTRLILWSIPLEQWIWSCRWRLREKWI